MALGSELLTQVRELTRDRKVPKRFSDELVLRYLGDGIAILCKQTHMLIDKSVYLSTASGQPTYTEPKRVLKVFACRIKDTNTLLHHHRGLAIHLHVNGATEQPTRFSTEMGRRLITFFPIPDATYIIEQLCAVEPKQRIEKDTESELDAEDETAVINYAASQCLLTNDIDGLNPGAGAELFNSWRSYVVDKKQEIYRYRTTERLVIDHWAGV